ncbi:MAG: hypothetical protein NWE79_02135 [Candidatus Bathyarchaeota archaeon]|nr:hypothetical protein [Candidatus Bathyarchaeota archaeon]
MNELRVQLDNDLYRYLSLLEKFKLVRCKEEAVIAAIRIFKKLNMQDWLPYVYRVGTDRVLIVGQGMLHDVFSSISDTRLYAVARVSAIKRKILKPFDPELDLTEPKNWDVVLNELQNFGWGKFTLEGEEIMVEFLGVPIVFLKGYLETLFQVDFSIHMTKTADIYVLSRERSKREVWR